MPRDRCHFHGLGGCSFKIDAAHVVPKQVVARGFPHGAELNRVTGEVRATRRREEPVPPWEPYSVLDVIWDARAVLPVCRLHHSQLDAYQLDLDPIPAQALQYAREVGCEWWLMRRYPKQFEEAC